MFLAQVTSTSSDTAAAGAAVGVLIVFLVIGLAVLAFNIWVLMDILKRPDTAWTQAGQNKQLWLILWVVGLCGGFTTIVSLIYLFVIKPKLVPFSATP